MTTSQQQQHSNTLCFRFGGMTVELSAAGVCDLLDELKPDSPLRSRLAKQAIRMAHEGDFSPRWADAILQLA